MPPEQMWENPRALKRQRAAEGRESKEDVQRQAETLVEEAEIVAHTRHDLREMEEAVRKSEKFAKVMDARFLDPVMSMLPIAGDAATSVAGLYIVAQALNAGVPKSICVKMVVNLILDAAVGAIPVIGDIADFFFKANKYNAKLFRRYLEKAQKEAQER